MSFMTRVARTTSITCAALALSFVSSASFANNCDSATLPAAPSIPAATERSTETMLATQDSVKSYVSASREYLKCVRSSRTHNAIVDQVYAIADEYNAALQEFKASTR